MNFAVSSDKNKTKILRYISIQSILKSKSILHLKIKHNILNIILSRIGNQWSSYHALVKLAFNSVIFKTAMFCCHVLNTLHFP